MISLLLSFFRPQKIIQIRRLPLAANLRLHLLGLTLAFVMTLVAIGLDYGGLFAGVAWLNLAALILIFALGTYIGGPFVLLTAILFFLPERPTSLPAWLFLFHVLAKWYFIGYSFGAILAIFYNDLIFLHMLAFGKKQIKIAFAYYTDPDRKIQIIKSPIKTQEAALLEVLKPPLFYIDKIKNNIARSQNARDLAALIRRTKQEMFLDDQNCLHRILNLGSIPGGLDDQINALQSRLETGDHAVLKVLEEDADSLLEQYLQLEEQKLYHFHLEAPPAKPYTIAFVANPQIHKRVGPPAFERDPIIDDCDLFLRAVDRALAGLEADDVLGRPEIWSRVRVVTIFDPSAAEALVEEYQTTAVIDGQVIDNLVNPMPYDNFKTLVNNHLSSVNLKLDDIDVVFALTASRTHDRSTAYYADWDENSETPQNLSATGKPYVFKIDPDTRQSKVSDINIPVCDKSPSPFFCNHDFRSSRFGRVALNVAGARQKTFIHEFAHAMSSASHGIICDEYADQFYVEHRCPDATPTPPSPAKFYINRIERKIAAPPDGRVIPVHEIFAEYNGVRFHSDLAHPSARENWSGYFPERHSPGAGCIMDRETGPYRFDKLISRFMYDRLVAKLNQTS